MVAFALAFFLAAAFSLVLTPLIAALGARTGIVDHPDYRKTHTFLVPRVGGASIALALALTLPLVLVMGRVDALPSFDPTPLFPILGGALAILAVGLVDDAVNLRPLQKLAGQLLAAAIVVGSGIVIEGVSMFGHTFSLGWLSVPCTLLWIVGITNAFNLVDGVDGLAGGLACIAASTCAAVLIVRGDYAEALLMVGFVGAVIGFLPYNFSPAEVFLGDSGSMLCGFLLAVTAIAGRQKGATALAIVVPLLTFALPILDTTWAIARRIVKGQNQEGLRVRERLRALSQVFVGDRGHIHHRLIELGLSHRRAVILLYGLALFCSALALMTIQP